MFNYLQYTFWKVGFENPNIIRFCKTEYNKYAAIGFNVFIVCLLLSLCFFYFFYVLGLNIYLNVSLSTIAFIFLRWFYLLSFYLICYSNKNLLLRIILSFFYLLITSPFILFFSVFAISNHTLNEQILTYSKINSLSLELVGYQRVIKLVSILYFMLKNDNLLLIVYLSIAMISLFVIFIPIIIYAINSHKVYIEIKNQLSL